MVATQRFLEFHPRKLGFHDPNWIQPPTRLRFGNPNFDGKWTDSNWWETLYGKPWNFFDEPLDFPQRLGNVIGFKIDGKLIIFDQIFIAFAGHGQDSTRGRATGHGFEKVRCMPPSGTPRR